jgi:arylamine N-acetyltransferase
VLTYFHPVAVKRFLKANNLENFSATLEFLEKFGAAFQKMPYENMTKLIRAHAFHEPAARLRLPEVLYDEHLRSCTGGTCFSMTYFMQTILRHCGFDAYPVIADRPLAPGTHCLSIIRLGGVKYILDPGFMIERPLALSAAPSMHVLRHNNIIVGARGAVPVPPHQVKYFGDLMAKFGIEAASQDAQYAIATETLGKTNIRYFFRDSELTADDFLKFWLDSFDWPTLRNISITVATDDGYVYARNDFLRKTTREGKTQERIKSGIDAKLSRVFGIDRRVISDAFEVLREIKFRACPQLTEKL